MIIISPSRWTLPWSEKDIESIQVTCKTKFNGDGTKKTRCFQKIDFREIKEENIDSNTEDADPPLHAKSLDMVAKHAKVYPDRGTLPSGHRGNLVKVRNGHGRYVPFS